MIVCCEQYSDNWWAERLGKPSASAAKRMVTSTGAVSKQAGDYALELANDLYAGEVVDSWGGNAATERGTELEDEARSFYIITTGRTVEEIGMFSDGMAVASPDGVHGDDGLIEIKCLMGKNHTKALLYIKANGKPPTDYVPQLQMQLLLSGRKWVDILFYHPVLPSVVIRVTPIEKITECLAHQIQWVTSERDSILATLKTFD